MKKTRKLSLILLLTLCVVCISMLQPMTVKAADNVPGGVGNTVVVSSYRAFNGNERTENTHATMTAADGYEIVAYLDDMKSGDGVVSFKMLILYQYNPSTGELFSLRQSGLYDYVGTYTEHRDGELKQSTAYTKSNPQSTFYYSKVNIEGWVVSCSVSGCKVFSNLEAMQAYAKDGSLDGMLKEPELDKDWYLENVGYKVDADDSPTSEAGEDATYITFTWDTDNLQDGDLLEIKTHNYLKKIGGDQISGFHDYITNADNVSAYSGKYRFSQYDATKAWFNTLDNKPLIFKSYDTDIYYLRPYRNGVYGGWVKITIGRSPVIKGSPYVEDIEYGDFDEDDEWVTDEELTEANGGHHGINQNGNIFYPDTDNPFEGTNVTGIFKWFFDFMKEIPSFLGDLPALVGSIIGFLPPQIIGFIAVGLVVAIILRIVGR